MNEKRDYTRDITEIRSMMERSSKFLSLSGWAGIMAGIYALSGAWIAYHFWNFNPDEIIHSTTPSGNFSSDLLKVIALAVLILILAIGTALFLSHKKACEKGEKVWNAISRRMVANLAVPLATGGILAIALLSKGFIGLLAPITMLFYGLALYNASKFTYDDIKILGMVQIGLGLAGVWYIEYGLLLWAMGFGVAHILYGIYMNYRYER